MWESECVCMVYLCKIISRFVCSFVCLCSCPSGAYIASKWPITGISHSCVFTNWINFFFYYLFFFIGTDVCCLKMSSGWAGGLFSHVPTMNAVLAKGKSQFLYCSIELYSENSEIFHINASYVYVELHWMFLDQIKRKISVAISLRLTNGFRSLPHRRNT